MTVDLWCEAHGTLSAGAVATGLLLRERPSSLHRAVRYSIAPLGAELRRRPWVAVDIGQGRVPDGASQVTRRADFKEANLRRALRAAEKSGPQWTVEVSPDGAFRFTQAATAAAARQRKRLPERVDHP